MEKFDVIIIGAGSVGSAVARELSRYHLQVAVLEKELDVVSNTSGRNSGVVHAGFNNKPGSLMAKYCVAGCLGFEALARELDVPYQRTGKLVIAQEKEDLDGLEHLYQQGRLNGCPDLRIITGGEIKKKLPWVEGLAALYSPWTSIFDPFIYTIALAENACQNGVRFFFDHQVLAAAKNVDPDNPGYTLKTKQGSFAASWVINCAGLAADTVAGMFGVNDYPIFPCRGEYLVLDKSALPFLPIPVYPVPNQKKGGLGVHLTPTTDGNVLIGPSNEYIDQPFDYATTKPVMDMLLEEGLRLLPKLRRNMVISSFAGVRPKLVSETVGGFGDFVILEREDNKQVIHLIGIESPGITASAPLARDIAAQVVARANAAAKPGFDGRRRGVIRFADQPDQVKAALIAGDPAYGEIICRCQTITKREILEAINNPLGIATMVSVKSRTRAMMGRCQGGFCQTRIAELIMEEKGQSVDQVLYNKADSRMFYGSVR